MILPRWAALGIGLFFWLALLPLLHGVLPWALSRLGARYGWVAGRPGPWNWLGLSLVAAATVVLLWLMTLHLVRAPASLGVALETTPSYLLRQGPYAVSRNPMYLDELALWLGWALFYGSPLILICFVLGCLVFQFAVVPIEERALEARFGEAYRQYQRTVPRWIGKPRR